LQKALTTVWPGPRRYPHQWIEPFELSRAIAAYEDVIDRVIAGSAP
jgi:hypothetical protein